MSVLICLAVAQMPTFIFNFFEIFKTHEITWLLKIKTFWGTTVQFSNFLVEHNSTGINVDASAVNKPRPSCY